MPANRTRIEFTCRPPFNGSEQDLNRNGTVFHDFAFFKLTGGLARTLSRLGAEPEIVPLDWGADYGNVSSLPEINAMWQGAVDLGLHLYSLRHDRHQYIDYLHPNSVSTNAVSV